MVLYWSPEMISCSPAMVASLPVTGGTGFTPAALNAAMVPPPVPSLAATTPAIRPGNRAICPPTQSWAFVGSHSGVSYSARVVLPLVVEPVVDALLDQAGGGVGR